MNSDKALNILITSFLVIFAGIIAFDIYTSASFYNSINSLGLAPAEFNSGKNVEKVCACAIISGTIIVDTNNPYLKYKAYDFSTCPLTLDPFLCTDGEKTCTIEWRIQPVASPSVMCSGLFYSLGSTSHRLACDQHSIAFKIYMTNPFGSYKKDYYCGMAPYQIL